MKKHFSKKQKRTLRLYRSISVGLIVLCMAVGTLTGILFFARPAASQIENRTLASFPAFSLGSFLDGSWFGQIALWYSDTYPGRDTLLKVQHHFDQLKGIQSNEMVIGVGQADTIGKTSSNSSTASKAANKDGTHNSAQPQHDTRTEIPDAHALAEDIQGQIMEGLLVCDGAVYGGYYFVEDSYNTYTQALERAAKELEGITDVYSILVPNNSGVLLDQETLNKLGGSDQKQAIDYYYTNYSDLIHSVGTIDILREHSNEYLYYRTDHHWTPLGAYYVYENFCKAKGIEPVDRSTLEQVHFEPFYGSYASQLPGVNLNADQFDGWIPKDTNTMKVFTDEEANPGSDQYYEHAIVSPDPNIDEFNQYMRLIAGDQPFEVIDNPNIQDGSSCLVIKESYGNAFVPWLVNNYDKVYVMDFRYSEVPIVTWCKEHEIEDLILINNMQLAASTSVADRYDALLH